MKTLLLCPELFARESGIQRILRLYLKALCDLAETGDEVSLVVLNDAEFSPSQLQRYANEKLTERRPCGRSKAGFIRQALRASAGANRVVCGHLGQLWVAWLARCLHPRLDYYLVAHGIEVWRPYSWIERLALRRARRILCVSNFTRREMQRRIALPESRFVVVPNGLDPLFDGTLPETITAPGDPIILTVARLDARERYKGVDHLIEALPAVRLVVPEARLRIIGTGSDLPRLQEMTTRFGVADAVDFAGFVNDDGLSAAYRECALFALPSSGEGFGIVFLEAMAHGKPCLGACAGAIPEIIDGTSGVLVDYGAISQIAAKTVWALQRPWNSEQIRQRAAQFSYPAFRARLQGALVG